METGYRHDASGASSSATSSTRCRAAYRRRGSVPRRPVLGISANPYVQFYTVARRAASLEFSWTTTKPEGRGAPVHRRQGMRRLALAAVALAAGAALAQERPIPAADLKVRLRVFSARTCEPLQNDDFANPGMLWVERGEKLWSEPQESSRAQAATRMRR